MCEKICEDLDELVIDYFNTLSDLYKTNNELEEKLKSGFLHMSRARYNMGTKSVGALQYSDNMQANFKIDITPDSEQHAEGNNILSFQKSTSLESSLREGESEHNKVETVLRKRNVGKIEEENSSEDIVKKMEKMKVEEGRNGQCGKDPLKWFGVLVPSSLRQSQADFRSSLDITIAQANLKQRLAFLQTKYKQLMQMKIQAT